MRTARELSAATGNACLGVKADVRDPRQVQAAVKQTIERFGRIDFVINGICPEHAFLSTFLLPMTTAFQALRGIFLLPFLVFPRTDSGL